METITQNSKLEPQNFAATRVTWFDRVRANPRVQLALTLLPPLLWISAFLLVPYAILFVYSFWRVEFQAVVRDWGLANYVKFFTNTLYWGTLWKSMGIAAGVTAAALLLSYPLAYLIAFKVRRYKTLLYMGVIIPLWVSYLVRAYAWKTILGSTGILNGVLMGLGVIHDPIEAFLYSPFAVMITLTHIFTPFMLMPIYSVLDNIAPALKEASADLGATRWQTFWRVIFPLSLPGVIAGVTLSFVLSLGDFIAPQLVGGPSGLMISNVVVSLFGAAYNWPLGAAVSFLLLLLVITILNGTQRLEGWLERRAGTAGVEVGR